ncbi:MAG: hypothetical protein P8N76_26130 [Pirellulaceae bacterium]|nr:hypothetical protein [Pirellulaceae bacterium]
MKSNFSGVQILAFCLVQASALNLVAQVEPGSTHQHLEAFDYFVGTWKFSGEDFNEQTSGTITWQWDLDQNALVRRMQINPNKNSPEGMTNMSVVLWDAKNKRILERGFGGYGGYGQSVWTKTSTGWKNQGLGKWVLWNGEQGTHESNYVLKSKDKFVIEQAFDLDSQEPATSRITVERVSESTAAKKNRCPWTWLIGNWSIERSSGTSSRVHWSQPYPNADYLIGEWEDNDGSKMHEIVGWQPSRKLMVSNSYGPGGRCSEIIFDEVAPKRIKGKIHNRDANGKVVTGTLELKQINRDLAKGRQVLSDGTVVTQTFRRISE